MQAQDFLNNPILKALRQNGNTQNNEYSNNKNYIKQDTSNSNFVSRGSAFFTGPNNVAER